MQFTIKYGSGNGSVEKMIIKLQKNMEREIDNAGGEWAKSLQRSMKAYAPKFSGQLAEGINVTHKKKGKWVINIDSPYAWYQEKGFEGKFLSSAMPVEGGYRIGDWMQAKGMSGFGFRPFGKPHPFIEPAFQSGLNRLPMIIDRAFAKAAKETGLK